MDKDNLFDEEILEDEIVEEEIIEDDLIDEDIIEDETLIEEELTEEIVEDEVIEDNGAGVSPEQLSEAIQTLKDMIESRFLPLETLVGQLIAAGTTPADVVEEEILDDMVDEVAEDDDDFYAMHKKIAEDGFGY